MKFLKKRIVFLTPILLLLFIYVGGSYYFSSEIIHFRKKTLEEDKERLQIQGFSSFGLPEPLSWKIKNREGLELAAWYFPNSSRKNCAITLVHGYTSSRWGVLKYAPIFYKRGCSVFTYDHRRHGESSEVYGTFGYYERYDLLDALEYLEKETGIPPENTGILGESLGASTAILAMAITDKSYAFLIAESPFRDLDSIVGKKAVEIYGSWVKLFIPLAYWIAEKRAGFEIEDVSPLVYAPRLKLPVLFLHSEADDYTPYAHSVDIYENTASPRKKIVLTDWNASHARSIDRDFGKFQKIVLDFLSEMQLDF